MTENQIKIAKIIFFCTLDRLTRITKGKGGVDMRVQRKEVWNNANPYLKDNLIYQ
jgi:hypothetical protein